MNELFTKRFWKDVKKTFDDAAEGPPSGATASEIPAESDSSKSETTDKE
jgi:hypothetical protein